MTVVALLVILVTRGRLAYKPPVVPVAAGPTAPVTEPMPMPS
jgi:hypothetical protein